MRLHLETIHRDGGFGLTEILVSLALLALVSLLMLQGLGAGHNLWRSVAARAEAAEDIQNTQTMLRERLERAYPATMYDTSRAYSDFEGNISTITFIAPPADAQMPNTLRHYALDVSSAGDLVLSSRSDLWGHISNPFIPAWSKDVLLHGVQKLDATYLESDGTGRRNGGWQRTWRNKPYLPALIRLQVVFAPGDHRWWPAFIVHPMATIDTECSLDRQTGLCGGRL